MTAFALKQLINGDGTYTLDETIIYESPRYGKTVTVPKGYRSDGATGAMDITSRGWWVHDMLCDRGTWDDGTKLSNWQCSQVLQDILSSEGRKWQGHRWFWATWLFGGGQARANGMLRVAAMLLVAILLSAPAFAESCGCPKSQELHKKELRQKLEIASANSKLLADIIVSTHPATSPDTRADVLEEYRYWADEVERLFEESIDEASAEY